MDSASDNEEQHRNTLFARQASTPGTRGSRRISLIWGMPEGAEVSDGPSLAIRSTAGSTGGVGGSSP
jgi:hypothetical protein